MFTSTDWLGFAAATCTTLSFLPQAIKTLRERDTRSLSLGMYVIFTFGVVLWGIYGYARRDWVIVVGNVITGALAGAILAIKIHNDARGR
jgi:MtN3 and saliva related transmembrane protein